MTARAPVGKRNVIAAESSTSMSFTRVAVRANTADGGPMTSEQHVEGVDRVGQERAAELGGPAAAPRHLVVVLPAEPRDVDVGHVGLPGQAEVDHPAELLDAVAEPVLEDRHDGPSGLGGDRGELVDLGDRPDERLLAEHVLAGPEHRLDLRPVEVRRGAQVDDVDLVVGQHLVEVGDGLHAAQPPGDLRGQVAVEVADGADPVEVAHVLQREHVGPTDAEADDRDADGRVRPSPVCTASADRLTREGRVAWLTNSRDRRSPSSPPRAWSRSS